MPTKTHQSSRLIHASPEKIYQALLDPEAVKVWRPPSGMTAEIYEFKPRTGGYFRMAFIYSDPSPHSKPKSTTNADIFHGTFVELVPNCKVVELVKFESDEPGYEKPITVTTSLKRELDSTLVEIVCENVPAGINKKEHEKGIASTLEKLSHFIESY